MTASLVLVIDAAEACACTLRALGENVFVMGAIALKGDDASVFLT